MGFTREIMLLVLLLLIGFVNVHTHLKCPNKLVLNEIFTHGQQVNMFTSGQPFIEIARSTDKEISLDKYSIAVYSVTLPNTVRLRALIDLKNFKLKQNQKLGVIGEGSYPNNLLKSNLRSTEGIFFNQPYHSLNYLSVGNRQYLVIALMYNGHVPDYTYSGQPCTDKCKIDSTHNGKNWCYTVSGVPSWEFCSPNQRGDLTQGYILDQQNLQVGILNDIQPRLWQYIEKNTIDLVVMRGKTAYKSNNVINERHYKSVGDKSIKYVTNPDITLPPPGNKQELFSISNCGITYDPFEFESWTITRPSPGEFNHCAGGVSDIDFPACPAANAPVPQTLQEDNPSCPQEVEAMIVDGHKQELESTYSRELKVTGNDMVSGTYYLTTELNCASGKPIYERESKAGSDINVYIIYHANDNFGWRIGNKKACTETGSYIFSSGHHGNNPGDTGVEWIHSDNQQKVIVERSESGQVEKSSNCAKSTDLNHDQAEKNIKLEAVVTRKRILKFQATREDREWLTTDHFKHEWLEDIDSHQSHLIPVEEVAKAKTWFEYLPANPKHSSRFRCRICHQNAEVFGIRQQHRSPLSEEMGYLDSKRRNNKIAIINHEESLGHMKVVQRLKERYDGSDLYDEIRWNEADEIIITARIMRTVYTAVKHLGASYNSMKYLITLQEQHGLKLGSQCKSAAIHAQMIATISDVMHEKLISSIKSSGNPLSLIVDTSTDQGNTHQLVVLFQTLEADVPVTYFYRFIKLGSDQTAEAQTTALIEQLRKDDLFDHVKRNIISFVSDGASVMTGHKTGMGVRLRKIFGPKLITHHCLNHRIELVFGHAMDLFPSFHEIEKNVNKLYNFYKNSGKTLSALDEYLDEINLDHFRLNYIHKIRWVASHYRAVKKVYDHLPEIFLHLGKVKDGTDTVRHHPWTQRKAIKILRFLTSKRAVLQMVYNLDAQLAFTIQSKVFESTEASIITMAHARTQLERDLTKVKVLDANSETQKFLSRADCWFNGQFEKCETIQRYETSPHVLYIGVRLYNVAGHHYDSLADVKDPYIDTILDLLDKYLPEIRINDFDLLDPRLWIDESFDINTVIVTFKMESIMKELKTQTPPGISFKEIGTEFFNLINTIRNTALWCTINESKPSMFWANVMNDDAIVISETLRGIIRSALAIPAGSAAAERSFGMLNYIKDPHRATLSQENTNHIVRIRHNGPRAGAMRMEPYVRRYLQSHERCDPLHDVGKVKAAKIKKETLEQENVYSSIFSFPEYAKSYTPPDQGF